MFNDELKALVILAENEVPSVVRLKAYVRDLDGYSAIGLHYVRDG